MIETYLPALVPHPTTGNITSIITDKVAKEPGRILLSRPLGDGWQPVTAVEFDQEIRSVAKGLIAHGIQRGDRVAIMAKTRYEWTILDFAIIYCGAITVPIYETSSAEQVRWILTDSASSILVVESPSLAQLAEPVLPRVAAKFSLLLKMLSPISSMQGAIFRIPRLKIASLHLAPKM